MIVCSFVCFICRSFSYSSYSIIIVSILTWFACLCSCRKPKPLDIANYRLTLRRPTLESMYSETCWRRHECSSVCYSKKQTLMCTTHTKTYFIFCCSCRNYRRRQHCFLLSSFGNFFRRCRRRRISTPSRTLVFKQRAQHSANKKSARIDFTFWIYFTWSKFISCSCRFLSFWVTTISITDVALLPLTFKYFKK